jgi:type I restriction-modification system DNA methylase subunit
VIDVVDFNATTSGQRNITDERLAVLVQVLSKHRLGLQDIEPDILGRAYEYLLRKFAEGQGQSDGEFYTPREVAVLMAQLLEPELGMDVHDPCCGSNGRRNQRKDAWPGGGCSTGAAQPPSLPGSPPKRPAQCHHPGRSAPL